jgi:hypothetical protein
MDEWYSIARVALKWHLRLNDDAVNFSGIQSTIRKKDGNQGIKIRAFMGCPGAMPVAVPHKLFEYIFFPRIG